MASVSEESYGDCKGPGSTYVKLVASDGQARIVKRELAVMSETLKDMLSYPYEEDETQEVVLKDVSSDLLDLVFKYLAYKKRYSDPASTDVPDFKITADVARELLMAADFLRC